MNLDLTSLFPDLEALTPDGRWNMLQDWLAENPEYGERAERWSTQTVDQVFDEILKLATAKYGPLATIALGSAMIAGKLKSTIEILQACYRERANHDNHSHISKPASRRRKGKLHAETKKTN